MSPAAESAKLWLRQALIAVSASPVMTMLANVSAMILPRIPVVMEWIHSVEGRHSPIGSLCSVVTVM